MGTCVCVCGGVQFGLCESGLLLSRILVSFLPGVRVTPPTQRAVLSCWCHSRTLAWKNLIMWSLESDLLAGEGAPGPRFLWVSLSRTGGLHKTPIP